MRAAAAGPEAIREQARALIAAAVPRAETKDADYVFLSFVMANLPRGLVGLLLAVILCAAMSSTASELTALGGCTVVDFYRRSFRPEATDAHYLRVAKLATGVWGVLAVAFAAFASLLDNLIQAVNILGSLFYGTILGIFLAAFFVRRLRATPVFVAAILSEVLVVGLWLGTSIGFLWFNVIGCAAVLILSSLLSRSDSSPLQTPVKTPMKTGQTRARFLVVLAAVLRLRRSSPRTPRPEAGRRFRRAPRAFQDDFVALLDDVQKKVLSLEEAVPQDKFKWRPAPGVRSIAEAYLHIAFGNYMFTKTATGKEPPADAGWEMNGPKWDTKTTDKVELKRSSRSRSSMSTTVKEVADADSTRRSVSLATDDRARGPDGPPRPPERAHGAGGRLRSCQRCRSPLVEGELSRAAPFKRSRRFVDDPWSCADGRLVSVWGGCCWWALAVGDHRGRALARAAVAAATGAGGVGRGARRERRAVSSGRGAWRRSVHGPTRRPRR